jgi:very-short-patch-repair endonuclease
MYNIKPSYEFVKNYFKQNNCTLVSDKYVNAKLKLQYICNKCNNLCKISFSHFKQGRRCGFCRGKILTFEYIKKCFLDKKCELLDTKFNNRKTKLKYKCIGCKKISSSTLNSIKYKRCLCFVKKEKFRFLCEYFKQQDCELLENEYINNRITMKYKCHCNNISKISYNHFMNGHRCKKCSNKKFRLDFEFIKECFSKENYILLSKTYINSESPLEYMCDKGHLITNGYNSFKQGKRCLKCVNINQTFDIKFVRKYFKENNCELISKVYQNCYSLLEFKCSCGILSTITFKRFKKGTRCHLCILSKNKTEKILYDWLTKNYSNIVHQAIFNWCKKKKKLPYDFLLNFKKIIIELDGNQHFISIKKWNSFPTIVQKNDFYKMEKAIENGYKIIRIYQPDVYKNNINWKKLLTEAIKNTDKYTIQFISKDNNIYNNYVKKFSTGKYNYDIYYL